MHNWGYVNLKIVGKTIDSGKKITKYKNWTNWKRLIQFYIKMKKLYLFIFKLKETNISSIFIIIFFLNFMLRLKPGRQQHYEYTKTDSLEIHGHQ